MDDTSDRVKLDEQAKRLHRLQEEDLKRRREENVVTQMRDLEQGKQFATNYPWDWGNTVKKDPRHRSTDISRKTEPMDRDKAMQYHADLDRIMEEKREAGRRNVKGDGVRGRGQASGINLGLIPILVILNNCPVSFPFLFIFHEIWCSRIGTSAFE
ncbi:hypothetical protein BC829DRAFT_154885 [Chytridium lagenaria]|nr:hypothetical protein BC829DRAFT_154885 [Chytridium lagenaria]